MRYASWRTGTGRTFGIVRADGSLVDLGRRWEGRCADLDMLIAGDHDAAARALADSAPADTHVRDVQLLPPLSRPGKILCVGVNYPERNSEYRDGSEQPKFPSLFVRFPSTLVGHREPVLRPPESKQFDYEGEIVLVIGKKGRRIAETAALDHVFGITLMNEGSVRDWLRHGKFNVTQGKNFDRSGSVGPWIVTREEAGNLADLDLVTRVNGEERQRGNTDTLMFPFERIIAYVSTFTTLEPGDMIATGTPPGAGARFDPPRWLVPGDVVEVSCSRVGALENAVADEAR